jgi:hypothetical protein
MPRKGAIRELEVSLAVATRQLHKQRKESEAMVAAYEAKLSTSRLNASMLIEAFKTAKLAKDVLEAAAEHHSRDAARMQMRELELVKSLEVAEAAHAEVLEQLERASAQHRSDLERVRSDLERPNVAPAGDTAARRSSAQDRFFLEGEQPKTATSDAFAGTEAAAGDPSTATPTGSDLISSTSHRNAALHSVSAGTTRQDTETRGDMASSVEMRLAQAAELAAVGEATDAAAGDAAPPTPPGDEEAIADGAAAQEGEGVADAAETLEADNAAAAEEGEQPKTAELAAMGEATDSAAGDAAPPTLPVGEEAIADDAAAAQEGEGVADAAETLEADDAAAAEEGEQPKTAMGDEFTGTEAAAGDPSTATPTGSDSICSPARNAALHSHCDSAGTTTWQDTEPRGDMASSVEMRLAQAAELAAVGEATDAAAGDAAPPMLPGDEEAIADDAAAAQEGEGVADAAETLEADDAAAAEEGEQAEEPAVGDGDGVAAEADALEADGTSAFERMVAQDDEGAPEDDEGPPQLPPARPDGDDNTAAEEEEEEEEEEAAEEDAAGGGDAVEGPPANDDTAAVAPPPSAGGGGYVPPYTVHVGVLCRPFVARAKARRSPRKSKRAASPAATQRLFVQMAPQRVSHRGIGYDANTPLTHQGYNVDAACFLAFNWEKSVEEDEERDACAGAAQASNDDVYAEIGGDALVERALDGASATIISSGSEQCGKAHMVWGPRAWSKAETPETVLTWGVAPRLLRALFAAKGEITASLTCVQNVGQHNRDLLTRSATKLHIHQFCAVEEAVASFEELCELLGAAEERAAKWPTLHSEQAVVGSVVTSLALSCGGKITFIDLAPEQHPANVQYGQWVAHPSHPELNPPSCAGQHPDVRRTKRMSETVAAINVSLSEVRGFLRATARAAKRGVQAKRAVGVTSFLAKYLREEVTRDGA